MPIVDNVARGDAGADCLPRHLAKHTSSVITKSEAMWLCVESCFVHRTDSTATLLPGHHVFPPSWIAKILHLTASPYRRMLQLATVLPYQPLQGTV